MRDEAQKHVALAHLNNATFQNLIGGTNVHIPQESTPEERRKPQKLDKEKQLAFNESVK